MRLRIRRNGKVGLKISKNSKVGKNRVENWKNRTSWKICFGILAEVEKLNLKG